MLEQGYWIMPNKVLYSKELTDKQKLLFCAISSLCAERGYCRATNEYLWELLWADKRTISRNLTPLQEEWFISIGEDEQWRRIITLDKNVYGGRQKCLGGVDKNVYHNNTIEYYKEKKESKKKENIPTPSDLVEAYRNTPALAQKINNEDVVREFAVYKQSTKRTAYKTVDWFIQKLIAYVNLVSYWEIRYDVWERLRYAVNEARDNWWIQLVRDEKTEQGYQTVKKFNSMTQKQNGQ